MTETLYYSLEVEALKTRLGNDVIDIRRTQQPAPEEDLRLRLVLFNLVQLRAVC